MNYQVLKAKYESFGSNWRFVRTKNTIHTSDILFEFRMETNTNYMTKCISGIEIEAILTCYFLIIWRYWRFSSVRKKNTTYTLALLLLYYFKFRV